MTAASCYIASVFSRGRFASLLFLPSVALAQLPGDVVIPGETPTETEGEVTTESSRLQNISIVVIDPGHGGDDAGAKDPVRGTLEKNLTLAIAKKIEATFSAHPIASSARVLLTRDDDTRRETSARPSLANESRADLLVSIHVNASPSPAARGFGVAYHDGAGANQSALRPRGGAASSASAPLPAQPWNTAQRSREEESARFAEIVRDSLAAKVTLPDRGVKRLPLAVLEGAMCPAVLVEVGYLTNDQEALALGTSAVQDAVAEAIAEAVVRMDAVMVESGSAP